MEAFSFFDESEKQVIAADKNGIVVYVNQTFLRACGYEKGDMLGQPFVSFLYNGIDFFNLIKDEHLLTLLSKSRNKKAQQFCAVQGKDGVWLFILDEPPQLQEKNSEFTLFETMLDSVEDFIFVKDVNGIYRCCNLAYAEKLIGLPKDKIIGKSDADLTQIDRATGFYEEKNSSAVLFCTSVPYEEKIRLATGENMIVDTFKVPFFDKYGNVKFIIGISRDISHHTNLKKNLIDESRKSRILFDLYSKASKHERPDEFIKSVTDDLISLYHLNGILFYLFSEERQKMLLFSSHGFDKKYIDSICVLSKDDEILKPLFHNGLPVRGSTKSCMESLLKPLFFKEKFLFYNIFSIVFREKLLGCIIFLERENQINQEQFSFISSVCDSLSVVINNFMLSEKQKRNYMELLNLQNQLICEKVAAENESKAQSKFIATLSHEIRTPLNGITGFLDLLSDSNLSTEQTAYVTNAKNASKTLLALINDILDISKIKSGGLVLENIRFNLLDTIKKIIEFHLTQAKEKGLFLKLHADPRLPKYVCGDPTRLKEILNNLISNAIKFTRVGGIDVTVKPIAADCNVTVLGYEVCDTGIGIESDKLKILFKPYSQADSSTARQYGGTGLGLSICKELVEHMGGSIQVKSTPKVGTKFEFTLKFGTAKDTPFPPTTQEETSGAKQNSAGRHIAKEVRILLAEDNEISRELIVFNLKKIGLSCDIACNGAQAVALAEKRPYDIIFMDCLMPEMDGYAATAQIRKTDAGKQHTVIIALTANSIEEGRQKCLKAGMDDFICKPLQQESLFRLIRKYYPSENSR